MPPRSYAHRPAGTDGTDFAFRETVEHRYRALPVARARLKRAVSALAGVAALRTAWAGGVALLAGASPAQALAVAAGATAVALLHGAGSAGGAPHKERAGLLALLPLAGAGLALAVTATAGLEHTAVPRHDRRPARAAELLEARAGVPPGVAGVGARAVDGLLDGGVVVLALCAAAAARSYNALATNKGAAARRG